MCCWEQQSQNKAAEEASPAVNHWRLGWRLAGGPSGLIWGLRASLRMKDWGQGREGGREGGVKIPGTTRKCLRAHQPAAARPPLAPFFISPRPAPLTGECVELGIHCLETSTFYFSLWLAARLLPAQSKGTELALSTPLPPRRPCPVATSSLVPGPEPQPQTLPSTLSRKQLLSWSVGTQGRCDRFCWFLLLENIAAHFASVLPLITTPTPRLGRAPGHLSPASAEGGGQTRTWPARGWAGAGETELSLNKPRIFIESQLCAQNCRSRKKSRETVPRGWGTPPPPPGSERGGGGEGGGR